MKLNKIVSLFSAAAVAASMVIVPMKAAVPVMAADAASAAEDESNKMIEKMNLLKGLDIFDGLSMKETRYVERGEFVTAISKFFYDDPQGAEDTARMLSLITVDDKFDSQGYMTIEEAAKYAVIALGYKSFAEEKGGSADDYYVQAKAIGILNGITNEQQKVLF